MFAFDAPVEIHDVPFRWALLKGVLPESRAAHLRKDFPHDLKQTIRVSGSDKTYSLQHRLLAAPDGTRTASGPWADLVEEVSGAAYRSFVEDIGRVDLRGAFIEVALNFYAAGGYMSAHTDRWPKLVTHVIYLADRWQPEWGGHLTILEGRDAAPMQKIAPAWPNSVLIVRSEDSWHAVEAVHPQAALGRQTIQVSFWAERPRDPAAGRVVLS